MYVRFLCTKNAIFFEVRTTVNLLAIPLNAAFFVCLSVNTVSRSRAFQPRPAPWVREAG